MPAITSVTAATLGVVGRIVNDGQGESNEFLAADPARFGIRDLEAFAEKCRLYGRPLEDLFGVGPARRVDLRVGRRRLGDPDASGGWVLIRVHRAHTADTDEWRGPIVLYSRVILRRSVRANVAADLATKPEYRKVDGAGWQMFNGQGWDL